ncbi:hypothetical protein [Bradyrhizobium sp. CCBAU 11357]|uniref:hypothetical protein n=1 Tax=Bradyrhizobium sp. CCBAU 11357 TaxID=1630808 RepID=UPI002303AED0|nr:hypothetical protein [Bradyrhizobium sp. CCBAU 11357]MDA9499544.1 hypothetical protein [Bradyrhizobium sp. CCBAU 11357]
MSYTVLIDDNFRLQDESERVSHGEFETAEEAVAACKAIIDEWLSEALEPGMSSDDLWQCYIAHGDDPWIQAIEPKDAPEADYDAWAYARKRCEAMGGGAVDL